MSCHRVPFYHDSQQLKTKLWSRVAQSLLLELPIAAPLVFSPNESTQYSIRVHTWSCVSSHIVIWERSGRVIIRTAERVG